jgi:hypothetical protein
MQDKHGTQTYTYILFLAAATARSSQAELSADVVLQCNKLVKECDAWILPTSSMLFGVIEPT